MKNHMHLCAGVIMLILFSCALPGNRQQEDKTPPLSSQLTDEGDFYRYSGDILLSKTDEAHKGFIEYLNARESQARGCVKTKYPDDIWNRDVPTWPNGIVPYFYDDYEGSKNMVEEGMEIIEKNCKGIDFIRVDPANVPTQIKFNGKFLRIKSTTDPDIGGSGTIGYIKGATMRINTTSSDIDEWTVVHELFHILGFLHEHERQDRKITILKNNIIEGYRNQFETQSYYSSFGSYDYDSIMHYDAQAFSVNPVLSPQTFPQSQWANFFTIITDDPGWQFRIGQRDHLSRGDIKLLNHFYDCPVDKAGYWRDRRHNCYLTWVDRRHDCLHWTDRRHDCSVWVDRRHKCDLRWVDRRHTCGDWVTVTKKIPWGGYWKKNRWPWKWVQTYKKISSVEWRVRSVISCGKSGWPHQELQSPSIISCGKKGWPHQELQTKSMISCGKSGWPHQELQTKSAISCGQHYWPHQEMQWVEKISCGKWGWPHQEWVWRQDKFNK